MICMIMLRLGSWQLTRAQHKQSILDQVQQRAELEPVELLSLIKELSESAAEHQFRQVTASGQYEPQKSIYIDNKVVDSRVGYELFTPLKIDNSDWWVLVDRGWLPVGDSRQNLPQYKTKTGVNDIVGRLRLPPAKPPLWNNDFSVSQGSVWQYLPIAEYADQMQMKLLPLVLELAPAQASEVDTALVRQWGDIDDKWVAKHRGYAFQWVAMAVAFLIACGVLIYRSYVGEKS